MYRKTPEADDGEAGGVEDVLAGIESGAGFAFGSARSGGEGGVVAIGGEALFGGRFGELRHTTSI